MDLGPSATIFLLTSVLACVSVFDAVRERLASANGISERLLVNHTYWQAIALASALATQLLPVGAELFNLGAVMHVAEIFAYTFFLAACFVSIKTLFDLSKRYSFSKEKPFLSELALFTAFFATAGFAFSAQSLPWLSRELHALSILSALSAAVLYFYSGERLSETFNHKSLSRYLPAYSLLTVSLVVLTQFTALVKIGFLSNNLAMFIHFISLVAIAVVAELDKSVSRRQMQKFAREHSF